MPPPERIAVFDNDGTLWPEDPLPFQLAYALYTLKQMTVGNPALGKDAMVQAALNGNFTALLTGPHHDGLLRIVALTHSGMTTDEFTTRAESWLTSAPSALRQAVRSAHLLSRCRSFCAT